MRQIILALTSVAVLIMTSCQAKEELITREDRLSKGNALIDQGRYDEAIEYFTDLLKADSHPHVKLALASSYAGRAGLRLEKIYSFVVVRDLQVEPVSFVGLPVEKQTQNLMKSLVRYSRQWDKVPQVNAAARADLARALAVLQGEKSAGVRLYSATLRVVLLKSVIEEGLTNWKQFRSQRYCSDDLQPYFHWVMGLLDNLILIAEDLQLAFPEKASEYTQLLRDLKEIRREAEVVPWPREQICF